IFGLLPRQIGTPTGVTAVQARRLLEKHDHGGRQGPLFARVVEVRPPDEHLIMAHLIKCGLRQGSTRTELVLPGEARFDIGIVMACLRAYSVGLPKEDREAGHLLICEDRDEFTYQVGSLSPYMQQAGAFASFLHGLLIDLSYRAKDVRGEERAYLAPA